MIKENYDDMIWDKNSFPNKIREDEDIILLVREDIAIIIFRAISLYGLFFLFLIFKTILQSFSSDPTWIALYDTLLYGVATFVILLFAVIFHNYYLSLQIVTTHRIIDIDQKGLFRRETNSTNMDDIQDISFKKNTFLATIFNFGDVIVQTSGQSASESKDGGSNGFVFNNVPNPSAVANLLSELKEKDKRNEIEEKARLEAVHLRDAMDSKLKNKN